MNAPDLPLRLLVSQYALERWREPMLEALEGRPVEFITLEAALAQGRHDATLAFVSRDITGLSTKHEPAPALRAAYDLLRRSLDLRWVHIHSTGTDRPVYQDLRARGVTLTTSSGSNAEVVAQTALTGLLALARRFPLFMAAQRERRWLPLMGEHLPRDLAGQTAVIVGWGPIAQRIATLLQVLGLRVVAVRTREQPSENGVEMVSYATLRPALARADWLLLACPLTEQTKGLVNAELLAALPPAAGFINVARGEVVQQADLIAALQAGLLQAGAFLDVFEHEPLPAESPLWAFPHVIVSPHSAGHSDGNAGRVAAIFLDNLRRWQRGEPLRYVAR